MFLKTVKTVFIVALLAFPFFVRWLAASLDTPWRGPGQTVIVDIEKGQSVRAVAKSLAGQGVIPLALPATLAYDAFYSAERVKAGEYEFSFPLSPRDALFKLFRGLVYLHPVTIAEGLTGQEVEEVLSARTGIAAADFRAAFSDTAPIADWDPQAPDLEGYLFPETYHFPKRTAAKDVVAAMVQEFRKIFDASQRARAAELGMSVREAVILASLIEKETALSEERPLVSAVFHNRLRLRMKLDCDPTVIYGLKREGRYRGRLLSRDLKDASAYNTYMNPGLPPGPICSPGRESIEAALYPAQADYLYFVAQGDGSHHFSRSFSEHREAVKRYQLQKK